MGQLVAAGFEAAHLRAVVEEKIKIDFVERNNYVLICSHSLTNLPANFPVILNTAFNDWLKKHPGIRVRTVLPITQDGQTTAIHLWYDKADAEPA